MQLSDPRGFALVLAAAAIPIVMMVAVLIIDLGMAQVMRAQLQSALDAAALAAVRAGTTGRLAVVHSGVTEYNVFVTDDQLAAISEHDLIPFSDGSLKREKGHWKSVEECTPVQDPITGEERQECRTVREWVHEGWYVNRLVKDRAREVIIPELDLMAATDRAEELLEVAAEQWLNGGFAGLFRDLQIDRAELVCEDLETGEQSAPGIGDCPNALDSRRVRVRYRIIQGSVKYRTMLAGAVLGLVREGSPDPWVTIRLGDQEASLELVRGS